MPYTLLDELEVLRQSFKKISDDKWEGRDERMYAHLKCVGVERAIAIVRKSFDISTKGPQKWT